MTSPSLLGCVPSVCLSVRRLVSTSHVLFSNVGEQDVSGHWQIQGGENVRPSFRPLHPYACVFVIVYI